MYEAAVFRYAPRQNNINKARGLQSRLNIAGLRLGTGIYVEHMQFTQISPVYGESERRGTAQKGASHLAFEALIFKLCHVMSRVVFHGVHSHVVDAHP